MKSFAQDDADLLLDALLGYKKQGFYIDVGAADFHSNTQLFYAKGWNGVNIEPNPESFDILQEHRPRDINIQIGVAEQKGILPFYSVPERKTRSSFYENVAKNCGYPYTTITVPVAPLHEILDQHPIGIIDFMSIDTEGSEEIVLRTNNWAKYRPRYIIIEIESPMKTPWESYLENQGYRLITKTKNDYNAIYKMT